MMLFLKSVHQTITQHGVAGLGGNSAREGACRPARKAWGSTCFVFHMRRDHFAQRFVVGSVRSGKSGSTSCGPRGREECWLLAQGPGARRGRTARGTWACLVPAYCGSFLAVICWLSLRRRFAQVMSCTSRRSARQVSIASGDSGGRILRHCNGFLPLTPACGPSMITVCRVHTGARLLWFCVLFEN